MNSQFQPQLVAQIFNLLYHRFVIGRAGGKLKPPAGCKPAIQQIVNLRYEVSGFVLDFGFRISDFYHG